MSSSSATEASGSFFLRHEFAIRRLHSLSGIVPLGAYMVVHLLTNATLLNGAGKFQENVMTIHSLGRILPFVEWGLIFLPLIFHALVGVWIARTGKNNVFQYRTVSNRRYAWQRWTGFIALAFIFTHVFHLHGWFHFAWWHEHVTGPLGMAQFRPYNAASTLAIALKGIGWPLFYAVGVLSCVYHLANGIWTAGITWGLWVSPLGQKRASSVCALLGIFLGVVGMSALWAAKTVVPLEAEAIENRMYEQKLEGGELVPEPEKRTQHP